MLHMPSPMLMGGEPRKTYAEWVAHITARAVGGSYPWTSAAPYENSSVRTTAASFTGTMIGSSWQRSFATSFSAAAIARVVQHALPTNDLTGATPGREIFLVLERSDTLSFLSGRTRNGYTSQSFGDGVNVVDTAICIECAWWSDLVDAPLMNNPFAGTAAVSYAAAGW